MQLPWISRAEYNAILIDRDNNRIFYDRAVGFIKDLRQEYADLLDKYHALRLQGHAIPEQQHFEEPVMPPEILMRAIREVSPTQDHAYSMNYQWAMALKDHWDDDGKMREAAQQIRYGSAYTPDQDDNA